MVLLGLVIGSNALTLTVTAEGASTETYTETAVDDDQEEEGKSVRLGFGTLPVRRIAHAGGGIGGQTYTNSREALLLNLDRGFEFFEIDFVWTSDGRLVTLHDWNGNALRTFGFEVREIPDEQRFKQWVREYARHENLTLDELAALMQEHPRLVLVTDIKDRNVEGLRILARTIEDFAQRVIPQIYHPREYRPVRKIGYRHIIWTLYRFPGNGREVLEHLRRRFLGRMKLFAVAMPVERAHRGLGLELEKLGIPAYVHTINSAEDFERYRDEFGIDEIYTDFLAPVGN